jgi:hypothetical protein
MQEKRLWFLFVLFSFSVSAQIKGVIKDSISGKPISYVNIWVQNENIGSSSEENGEFYINANQSKTLIFSALGYEKKIVKASSASVVILKPTSYQLDELVIAKRFETKIIEIGKTKTPIYQAFDNGPRIDVKYFPYLAKYKSTRYIKQVAIETDSKIDNATVKIHFYKVGDNGFPSEELLTKDLVVTVKKGAVKNFYNLVDLNLKMPKKGIFVGFEKLIIEKNKTEETITNFNNNITSIKKTYYPLMLYNFVERDFIFTFSGGKWNKEIQLDKDNLPIKKMVNEPAINLILSN